jgi:aldehyde dehydrogenase (NAD+)
MSAAARNLTPVVLELGGKSPCIIDKTANIEIASRRITWGKTLNSGQTCIAPDYLIIHKDVKEAFIDAFGKRIKELHGDDILESPHYVHMVNEKAFQRVCSYIQEGKIAYGGRSNPNTLSIEPTLLEDVPLSSPVMVEEIFGPVFPMIVLDDSNGTPFKHKVTAYLQAKEKPLALYWFGEEKDGWEVIRNTSSGGACINDVIMHIANERLPFGGVGNSGMGSYHNRRSFECFSHSRAVLVTPTWIDLPFRYMPYKLFSLLKRFI